MNQYRSAETIRLLAYLLFVGYVALVIACYNVSRSETLTTVERNTVSGFNRQQLTQHEPTIEIYNERGVLTNR